MLPFQTRWRCGCCPLLLCACCLQAKEAADASQALSEAKLSELSEFKRFAAHDSEQKDRTIEELRTKVPCV